MIKKLWEDMKTLWSEKVAPVMGKWWDDLGDHPMSHFVTFVATLAIYFAVKLVRVLLA